MILVNFLLAPFNPFKGVYHVFWPSMDHVATLGTNQTVWVGNWIPLNNQNKYFSRIILQWTWWSKVPVWGPEPLKDGLKRMIKGFCKICSVFDFSIMFVFWYWFWSISIDVWFILAPRGVPGAGLPPPGTKNVPRGTLASPAGPYMIFWL